MGKPVTPIVDDAWTEICWCGRAWGDCLFPWACAKRWFSGESHKPWSPARSGVEAPGHCQPHPRLKL